MDSLADLLDKFKPEEPPEIRALKAYIERTFHAPASIGTNSQAIVITVASAALANSLRLHTTQLQAAAQTERRIVFRISH